MNSAREIRFSLLVGRRLEPEEEDARELWIPVAQVFDRDGPDAARAYLDAEGQRLEERIQSQLDQVNGE